MRKLILLSIIGIFTFAGCVQTKSLKTIENLKTVIISETTASIIYAAYSEKAQLNYPSIAKLFDAVSKSDSIHAANYKKLLQKMGGSIEEITPVFEIKPTLENLQVAVKGVSNSVDVIYPAIIADAITEKSDKAVKSFTWACETEKASQKLFKNAITAVFERIENNNKYGSGLPKGYAICPGCGNIYDNTIVFEECEFCLTEKEKFLNI